MNRSNDETAPGGDVVLQVLTGTGGTERPVASSGTVTGTSPLVTLTADLAGAQTVRLHVDPDGATTDDHADWLTPRVTCA